MKQFCLSFFFLSFFVVINAQETEVIGNISNPLNLQLNGSELFICEHDYSPGLLGKVIKIDLADPTPTETVLITSLNYPRAITKYGNEIYFCNNNLYKFDINDPNPTADLVTNVSTTRSIIEYNGFLYLGRNSGIYRIDLTQSNPVITTVVTGLEGNPLGLTIKDNFLYLGYSNKVSRIDLTDPNPVVEIIVENLESNVYALIFQDNTLLVGLTLASKILKIDMDQLPYTTELFWNTVIGRVGDFAIWNNDLYIAGSLGNNIYKIEDLPALLSIDEPQPAIGFKLFPNPSTDEINLFGISNAVKFQIFNLSGQMVLDGINNGMQPIDISNLELGLYHLVLNDGNDRSKTLKFIKR
ncbi:MAG: T9SS type A sorting domain-containing protein [Psychroserpens sp.]|nr:T9SS type A sorting domain-containing protein [Psychroserpens sp.]